MTDRPSVMFKDGQVYYGDTLMKGVSPNGFEILVHDKYGMYARDAQGIWYFTQRGSQHVTRFVTQKADSFHLLALGYGADADTVFFMGSPIKSARVSSFRVIDRTFAADDRAVYVDSINAEGFQIWTDFDFATLQFFEAEKGHISNSFADRFHVYNFNGHFVRYTDPHTEYFDKQKRALQDKLPDAKSWWNLPRGFQDDLVQIGENFFTNGDFVFYRFTNDKTHCCQYSLPLRGESFLILPDADSKTFKALNEYYGADDNAVYCQAKKVQADTKTFQALEREFGLDNSGLWFNGFHVPDIDASAVTIHIGAHNTFAHDSERLFQVKETSRLGPGKGYARRLKHEKKGDPETFEILSEFFAKDKNQVYRWGAVFKAPDPETFEFVLKNRCSEFARDRHHLYRADTGKVFKNIDGATFQLLNQYWAKDNDSVIYMGWEGKVMRQIDRESFEVLDDKGTAQDARKRYWIEYEVLKSRKR